MDSVGAEEPDDVRARLEELGCEEGQFSTLGTELKLCPYQVFERAPFGV